MHHKDYKHVELGTVRVIFNDKEPLFTQQSVTAALGYVLCQQAVDERVSKENKFILYNETEHGRTPLLVLNESGVRELMSPTLPKVKVFKDWFDGTVLPAAREMAREPHWS